MRKEQIGNNGFEDGSAVRQLPPEEDQKGQAEPKNVIDLDSRRKNVQAETNEAIGEIKDELGSDVIQNKGHVRNPVTGDGVSFPIPGERDYGSHGREKGRDGSGGDGTSGEKKKKHVAVKVVSSVLAVGLAVTTAWMAVTDRFDAIFGNGKPNPDVPPNNPIATPGSMPSQEATPGVSPTESVEVTPSATREVQVMGPFVNLGEYDLSSEQYENLAKITKESILNFFENGFDTSDPNYLKIVRGVQGGGQVEYEGLGTMEVFSGGEAGELSYCQVCILGAEVRDGYPILFFGCENKDKERIVFPCRFDFSGTLFTSNDNSTYDAYRVNEEQVGSVYTTPESFYNFICSNVRRIALIEVVVGPFGLTSEEFRERVGDMDDVSFEELYYLNYSGDAAGAELFRNINIVDEGLSNWEPENQETFEGDILLSGDNLNVNLDLFQNIPTDRFPLLFAISMFEVGN